MEIPAVRGSLDCTIVSEQELKFSFFRSSGGSGSYVSTIHMNGDVPVSYMLANNTYRKDNYSIIMGDMTQAYAASFRQWLPSSDRNATVIVDEHFPGCPNIMYILGYFDMEAETARNVSATYCYQTVEQVETNTTFGGSQQYVSSLEPPIVNESSVTVLQDRAHYPGMKWFSGITQFDESHDLRVFDSILVRSDLFTQHLILGIDGAPLEEMIGLENRPRLLSAMQNLCGRYMVRPIHSLMRIKVTGQPIMYPATSSMGGWTNLRFTQSETSKLILQVLLCVMVGCGGLAIFLTPMRRVLVHRPGSIAGTMTLLAGSRLCERGVLRVGSEYLDDRGLDALLEGFVFTMGWSEGDDVRGGKGEGGSDEGSKRSEDDGDAITSHRRRRRYGVEAVEIR